ncbi:MAG: hypothetical protein ABFC96_09070 [Thermoguttaceae bacterium]
MARTTNRRRFIAAAAGLGAGIVLPALVHAEKKQADWGDLQGRFVYDGKPPERKKLTVDKDLECCGQFDIRDESLLVAADGGLANVYVYLRTPKVAVSPELAATAAKQVVLDNRDCIFKPHCMAVWYPRQQYSIVNSDPIAQNVAFSPLGDTPANIVLPVGGKAVYKFTRKQTAPVAIACNYHPWERAYVLPRDNPYAAISSADGRFSIAKLPIGQWEFQVWHETVGGLELPKWPKGRFRLSIKPGVNDLGAITIAPARLEKRT